MLDLTKSNEDLAAELAVQPHGTNPFDLGLQPLISGKEGERNLDRAEQILAMASDLATSTGDKLKGLSLKLYRLEVERRYPNADMSKIKLALDETLRKIEALVGACDLTKFGALLGDSWYNLALACRMTCEYEEAAWHQQKAASYYTLAGQPDKAWSSLFLVVVERFTATVVETGDPQKIEEACDALMDMRGVVDYLFPGDKMPAWLARNRHAHCVMATTWSNLNYNSVRGDTKFMSENLMGHLSAMAGVLSKPADEIVAAAEAMANKYWDFPSSSTGNAVLTALLEGARMAEQHHDRSRARKLCKRILSWYGTDGAAPMAIAKRMLSQLNKD